MIEQYPAKQSESVRTNGHTTTHDLQTVARIAPKTAREMLELVEAQTPAASTQSPSTQSHSTQSHSTELQNESACVASRVLRGDSGADVHRELMIQYSDAQSDLREMIEQCRQPIRELRSLCERLSASSRSRTQHGVLERADSLLRSAARVFDELSESKTELRQSLKTALLETLEARELIRPYARLAKIELPALPEYETSDLQVAAFILASGELFYLGSDTDANKIVHFIFLDPRRVGGVLEAGFRSGAKIEAKKLFDAYFGLRKFLPHRAAAGF